MRQLPCTWISIFCVCRPIICSISKVHGEYSIGTLAAATPMWHRKGCYVQTYASNYSMCKDALASKHLTGLAEFKEILRGLGGNAWDGWLSDCRCVSLHKLAKNVGVGVHVCACLTLSISLCISLTHTYTHTNMCTSDSYRIPIEWLNGCAIMMFLSARAGLHELASGGPEGARHLAPSPHQ